MMDWLEREGGVEGMCSVHLSLLVSHLLAAMDRQAKFFSEKLYDIVDSHKDLYR